MPPSCDHVNELRASLPLLSSPGNDLNEDITPIEAGLTWTVGKRRREAFDFLGGQVRAPLAPTPTLAAQT